MCIPAQESERRLPRSTLPVRTLLSEHTLVPPGGEDREGITKAD